jgi:hypothetical protein
MGMGQATMKIDGHCHCGRIAFEAEVDPETVALCHCTDCQSLSGSPYRASIAAPAAHFVLRGEPKTYVKIAENGARRRQAFCGDCGAPIYSCAAENPKSYTLRIGSINQRAAFSPPRLQIWRGSALPWVDSLADIPANEQE